MLHNLAGDFTRLWSIYSGDLRILIIDKFAEIGQIII